MTPQWMIEVKTKQTVDGKAVEVWLPMRPHNAPRPYVFQTEQEALQIARMCYPGIEHSDVARVVPVQSTAIGTPHDQN